MRLIPLQRFIYRTNKLLFVGIKTQKIAFPRFNVRGHLGVESITHRSLKFASNQSRSSIGQIAENKKMDLVFWSSPLSAKWLSRLRHLADFEFSRNSILDVARSPERSSLGSVRISTKTKLLVLILVVCSA